MDALRLSWEWRRAVPMMKGVRSRLRRSARSHRWLARDFDHCGPDSLLARQYKPQVKENSPRQGHSAADEEERRKALIFRDHATRKGQPGKGYAAGEFAHARHRATAVWGN